MQGARLDDAAAHEGAIAHGELPLAVEQHAYRLPPRQRKSLLRQRRRVPVLPAAAEKTRMEAMQWDNTQKLSPADRLPRGRKDSLR